jgi:hypothetical protein
MKTTTSKASQYRVFDLSKDCVTVQTGQVRPATRWDPAEVVETEVELGKLFRAGVWMFAEASAVDSYSAKASLAVVTGDDKAVDAVVAKLAAGQPLTLAEEDVLGFMVSEAVLPGNSREWLQGQAQSQFEADLEDQRVATEEYASYRNDR